MKKEYISCTIKTNTGCLDKNKLRVHKVSKEIKNEEGHSIMALKQDWFLSSIDY